ncbi:MAG: SIMPL domain-containing protein [Paramuribaculum sp.]|nr:SIMPL domain-containing protein [Paramuribaculum sp.]MDE6303728.1 SIMPL domain-containing protein [Paramuribaculum sp.]
MKISSIISSAVISIGLLALGLCVRSGLKSFTDSQRKVEVKGLCEREVPANQVTWPIVFSLGGSNLPDLYSKVESTNKQIINFLTENGVTADEVSVSAPKLSENTDSYNYKPGITPPYTITSTVTVSSDKVELVRGLITRQGDLLSQGIPVVSQDYGNTITYSFTDLNSIKPEMIAEATQNAREAANKFAEDSDSKLGKIFNAKQGQFSITDRDNFTPYIKTVRVVTSLTYLLED